MNKPNQAHDQKACNALKEYVEDCKKRQAAMSRNGGKHLPKIDKAAIADEWYTTTEQMDRHCECEYNKINQPPGTNQKNEK